ncbi:VOC family protein [Salininema proteolyticum]|uniref:VOC family protein n=1 Tax=Salininema proteolyticum TaxID=1607685 RepID=A0ABV8TXQ9_9ACTN
MSQMFINLPVSDLDRAKKFYQALGWTINPDFTDENAACVVVEDGQLYVMLLVKDFFAKFIDRPISDTSGSIGSLYALAMKDADSVNRIVDAAVAAGGREQEPNPEIAEMQKEGGMVQRVFIDPDGHQWEPIYMDFPQP